MQHTFQTNGILLDDDWCAFFKKHDFLVGLSVDGPRELHDAYRRRSRADAGTFDRVMQGWQHLRRHEVDFNILCTVNAANEKHGRDVYRFFRDELGAKWMQFIPIVERATRRDAADSPIWAGASGPAASACSTRRPATSSRSARSAASSTAASSSTSSRSGCATTSASVYVQLFDVTLEAYFGRHLLCIHAPTCGYGPALESNGDLYSCDHFVEPRYLLGNIHETHMLELVASPEQRKFGEDKRDTLTAQCRSCEVRQLCNGGCPKDRFARSRDGEPGQNYLCAGLELFFKHTRPGRCGRWRS